VCGSSAAAYTGDTGTQVTKCLAFFARYLDDEYILRDGFEEDAFLQPHAMVQGWNDDYDRTADHVTAALRAAADEWDRNQGGAR
jgi:hypothetical protein